MRTNETESGGAMMMEILGKFPKLKFIRFFRLLPWRTFLAFLRHGGEILPDAREQKPRSRCECASAGAVKLIESKSVSVTTMGRNEGKMKNCERQ
jgi:hypothetical protein